MCNDKSLFNLSGFNRRLDFPSVLGANLENPLSVEGIGSISLPLSGGSLMLKDVLYVPNIARNLICVSRLLPNGYSLNFNAFQSGLPSCVLKLKGRVICVPKQINHMWAILPPSFSLPHVHVSSTMAD